MNNTENVINYITIYNKNFKSKMDGIKMDAVVTREQHVRIK